MIARIAACLALFVCITAFPAFAQAPDGPAVPPAAKRQWGPEQATGAPDTNSAGDLPTAWAALRPDGGAEWLQLEYERPVSVATVRIRETFNPGAVSKVTAIPQEGEEAVLWEGQDPTGVAPAFFEVQAQREVVSRIIKVYLDTTRKRGWNEIDAVELVAGDGTRQWATQATASSTYADQGRGATGGAGNAAGENVRTVPQLTRVPAHIVEVDPPLNAVNVDPARRTISVTFDRPMQTAQAWSWMNLAPYGLYPGTRDGAEPQFDATGRTCTLTVSLQPNTVYAVGINSPRHTGFKDTDGIPALNFGWAFATGGYQPEELPPKVVSTTPAQGANDVDPALAEISVTFDRTMRMNTWSWVLQPERGEYPGGGGGEPRFSDDGLTCTLPVRLRPGTVYAVSINSYQHTGFKSRAGAPCLPLAWAFKTRGDQAAIPPVEDAAAPAAQRAQAQ